MVGASPPQVPRTEELRLAMVMNGGVSLAVWMGGVTFEINRFVGETHPVYRELLELTRTRARVDVISGTSAGGINGAALALASIYDTSLASLRNIWLDRAAFSDLLRASASDDPPSILDGDGYFLPMLREAFGGLTRRVPRNKDVAPMDLTLTTTLLRGELSTRLDSLGELVEDATHRGQFRFRRHPQVDADSFAITGLIERLSRAARSSASFPVAFEPVLAAADELSINGRTPAAHAHFVIDGGVLDNKPIEGALRAIYSLPAQGNVRRVLAYVVPDPGVSAAREPDTQDNPPMLAQVALSSMVTIPGVESIADQLDQIDTHNKAVRHNRSLAVTLTSTVERGLLTTIAWFMFDAYRAHRIGGLLDYVLGEIERCAEERQRALRASAEEAAAARTSSTTQKSIFGSATRQWLKATWQRIDPATQEAMWGALIPTRSSAFIPAFGEQPTFLWGLYALEYLLSVVMDVLRRTLRLQHVHDRGESTDGPVSLSASRDGLGARADWESEDEILRAQRAGRSNSNQRAEHLGIDAELSALCNRVFALAKELRDAREDSSRQFHDNAAALLDALSAAVASEGSAEVQERIAQEWLQAQFTELAARSPDELPATRHLTWATEIVDLVLDLKPFIDRLIEIDAAAQLRPEEVTERNELAAFAAYLYGESDYFMEQLSRVQWNDRSRILLRLLAFEIFQYALASRPAEVDSVVELVQISARQQSPLGGAAAPEEKLAGMQIAHFGAFYRKAWRENDWMMGRLDGMARIVRIALNPERLHRLYAGRTVHVDGHALNPADYVFAVLRKMCVIDANPAHREYLEGQWTAAEARIREELEYLRSPRARVQEALPASAEMLTRRLHLEVLCNEIPQLAAAVAEDIGSGAASVQGRKLLGQLGVVATLQQGAGLPASEAIRLFNSCRLGSESLAQEVGTDLMLRTGSQSLYVAFAAATGARSGLGPLAKLLNAFRWPIVTFYLLANRISQGSRADAAITTAMLLAGALLAGLGTAWADAPVAFSVAGWSLLFAWFATAYLRQTWVFLVGLFVVGAVFCISVAFLPASVRAHTYQQISGPLLILGILFFTVFMPRWATSVLVVLGAAWWFSGMPAPTEVRSAACDAWGLQSCAGSSDDHAGASFINALIALSLILVLVLLSRLPRRGRRR